MHYRLLFTTTYKPGLTAKQKHRIDATVLQSQAKMFFKLTTFRASFFFILAIIITGQLLKSFKIRSFFLFVRVVLIVKQISFEKLFMNGRLCFCRQRWRYISVQSVCRHQQKQQQQNYYVSGKRRKKMIRTFTAGVKLF